MYPGLQAMHLSCIDVGWNIVVVLSFEGSDMSSVRRVGVVPQADSNESRVEL